MRGSRFIVTLNWDTFLQTLFPDYRVYVGQDELLFSNPQSIGEIYKIHGCVNTPRSLVLGSSVKFDCVGANLRMDFRILEGIQQKFRLTAVRFPGKRDISKNARRRNA